MRAHFQASVFLGVAFGAAVAAAAPPKEKDDAPEVVIGIVQRIEVSEDKYEDRVVIKHTAILKVETVERTTLDQNRVVRAGDTITVRWSRVDWPSRTAGHLYEVKEKATVRAHLARQCGGEGFYVIDNPGGIGTLSLAAK